MKHMNGWLLGLFLTTMACSQSEDAIIDALNEATTPPKTLNLNDYQKADPQAKITDLAPQSVLLFQQHLILNNDVAFESGGLGVFLEKGTQLSTEEILDVEQKQLADFCVITTDTKNIMSKMAGQWLTITAIQPKIQASLLSTFEGTELQFQDKYYQGVTVRGQTVEDLTRRCFGNKVEVYVPIQK